MPLRAALVPREPEQARLAELGRRIAEIEEALARGGDAADLIGAFNRDTGHSYAPHDFRAYSVSRSREAFAFEAALPLPGRVDDLTREELVDIVRRLMPNQAAFDERFERYFEELFEANVPHPQAASLVHADVDVDGHTPWEPTPERVVDRALAYRPILL